MRKITKDPFHRKPKNKFIHAPDNPWTKCIVTKLDDSLVYEKKPVLGRDELVKTVFSGRVGRLSSSNNLHLTYNGKIIGFLPRQLSSIFEAIEKSRYILRLKENCDDENSTEYDFDVWKKTILFVAKLSTKIYKTCGQIIKSPKIYHGPNGSIDVYWENESFNLLINIPKKGLGTFYGDNYGNNKSEGFFDPVIINIAVFPFLIEL